MLLEDLVRADSVPGVFYVLETAVVKGNVLHSNGETDKTNNEIYPRGKQQDVAMTNKGLQ